MKRAAWSAIILLLVGCHGSKPAGTTDAKDHKGDKTEGEVLDFDLSSGIHESSPGGIALPIPASRTYAGLVREIERASKNDKARGFFIHLGDSSVDWSHAEELGLAFQRLRESSKKPVVCHAHSLDNKSTFFLGRACTKIWVSPAGDIDTVGIGGQVVYLKGALDKLKIRADFLHMGRYKSAAESLTQEGPSNEARESLTAVFASMRDTWLEGFASARTGKDMAALLEDGPWGPDDAKEHGMIDAVGYEDEALREAKTLAHVTHARVAYGKKKSGDSSGLAELFRVIAGGDNSTKQDHIAVLAAEGSIAMSGGGPLSDSGITAKAMEKVIRKLTADDAVKAVVLRIDSPGGSALASDLIWHDLMELRKKKPLIASVGDMAASGGYYLACAATKVVAERTSIVGSIGVLGGKIVIDEALAEVGVHAVTFPASPAEGAGNRAGYQSPFSPWDDATREKVRKQMASVYELFLRRVAEGRGLPVDAIRAVAEGRIWSGVQGLKLHLVDELGGLGRSLDMARSLAKLDADAPVRVEGISEGLIETLLGTETDEASLRAASLRLAEQQHLFLDHVAGPFRPFIASLGPLLEGETTIVALPFGVVVR